MDCIVTHISSFVQFSGLYQAVTVLKHKLEVDFALRFPFCWLVGSRLKMVALHTGINK